MGPVAADSAPPVVSTTAAVNYRDRVPDSAPLALELVPDSAQLASLAGPIGLSVTLPALAGRALLVGSSGGHLAQLLALAPLWTRDNRSYVTFDTIDAVSLLADEQVTWAHHPTTRNARNLARNSWLAVRELRARRPDVVVSTGAAVAFPFFVVARAMGIPTVYVEVYDRIDGPTLTGRLCRPVSTLFCVQWPEQLAYYRGAKLVGSLM